MAELYQGESNAALVDKFISTSVMDYYKKHLEDYNTEFRYQMEEFKDGNVLFEIMERNIWGKALPMIQRVCKNIITKIKQIPLGGKCQYNYYLTAANKTIAEDARAALLKGKNWQKIVEEANNNLQADSGRFEVYADTSNRS